MAFERDNPTDRELRKMVLGYDDVQGEAKKELSALVIPAVTILREILTDHNLDSTYSIRLNAAKYVLDKQMGKGSSDEPWDEFAKKITSTHTGQLPGPPRLPGAGDERYLD